MLNAQETQIKATMTAQARIKEAVAAIVDQTPADHGNHGACGYHY